MLIFALLVLLVLLPTNLNLSGYFDSEPCTDDDDNNNDVS